MLQQTTVATVGAYFDRFLTRCPTVDALAAADLDDVLHAWQGMGYYARARNLHACARAVVDGARRPVSGYRGGSARAAGHRPYTAGAIAAIAFDRKAAAVDGNVERVIARLAASRRRCRRRSQRSALSWSRWCRISAPATSPRR